MNNSNKGKLGEDIAKNWLVSQGYKVLDKNKEIGYDIKAELNGITYKIEVKTNNSPYGIPDMHDTEFIWNEEEKSWKFTGDKLLIIRLNKE